MIKKTTGIVLREIKTSNENDKIIIVLTKDYGKKSFYLKNFNKKNVSASSVMSYSEIMYTEGQNFLNIKEINQIESFYNIRTDVKKFAYCQYILEFTSEFLHEHVEENEILKLLYTTLNLINKSFYDLKLIKVIYEIKMLCIMGQYPEFFSCNICGSKTNIFDYKSGGLVCNCCKDIEMHMFEISNSTQDAYKYIVLSDIGNIYKFKVNDLVLKEMEKVNEKFIIYNIDKVFKSLKFIKILEGEE